MTAMTAARSGLQMDSAKLTLPTCLLTANTVAICVECDQAWTISVQVSRVINEHFFSNP